MSDLMKQRERAFEADYFRKQDEKLLAKLRERAGLQEIAKALAAKMRIDDVALMHRVSQLGLDRDTGAAILLAPLVQVAWAEGEVTQREREVVFEIAEARGVTRGTPAHKQLEAWLKTRPSDEVFEIALEVLRVAEGVLTPAEREARIKEVVRACELVARASGGGLGRLLGLSSGIDGAEASVLEAISAKLRSGPRTER